MDRELWKENWSRLCRHTRKTAEEVSAVARAGASRAGQAAENAVLYTRTKMAIMDLKAEINVQLRTVGEMVYATHSGDPTNSDTIHSILEQIDQLKKELRQKEGRLKALRGIRICPACGSANPAGHTYCSGCGQRMA